VQMPVQTRLLQHLTDHRRDDLGDDEPDDEDARNPSRFGKNAKNPSVAL